MQLYFIRHAQSENNALWARTGSSDGRDPDPALTAVGHKQAQILAQFLAQKTPDIELNGHDVHNRRGFEFSHLYTSLMQRAVTTGTYVAEALAMPLVAWEMIHEHGGIYRNDEETGEKTGLPGADRAYFAAHYPHLQLSHTLDDKGWWDRPYEPWTETQARAQRFFQELGDRHGGTADRVAIVSHGGFYYAFMAAVLNFTPENAALDRPLPVWFKVNNVSITRIDFNGNGIELVYLNRVDFLPAGLIT